MSTKNIQPHPLITLKEKHQEELIAFTGYAGSKTGDILNLYTDLSATVYYEIPEKSILYIETACKDCGDENLISIYVFASLKIKLIKVAKAAQFHSPNRPFPFQQFPETELITPPSFTTNNGWSPSPGCIDRCIQSIRLHGNYFTLIPGSSSQSIQYILNQAGKTALYNCLYGCGYRGTLLTYIFRQAIEKLNGEATYREDPPMPEIPEFP